MTSEGVDEGSKDSVLESSNDKVGDAMGPRTAGMPDNAEQNAAPEPLGDEAPGPGQRNEVGEG